MSSRRLWFVAVLVTSAATFQVGASRAACGQQQNSPPQKKKESLARKLLRISGISASPSTLKGPGDEVSSGEIWLADVTSRKTRKLTNGGGYRSPLFLQANNILALKSSDVVRLPASGGEARKLYTIGTALKLVGASLDDPNQVLVVTEDESGHAGVAWLSVNSGKLTPIAFDSTSREDREMLQSLRSWDRTYANQTLFVKKQTKQGLAGTVEWIDVFLKAGTADPVNVSHCDGVNCGQPSLSSDGRLIVFIRSDQT